MNIVHSTAYTWSIRTKFTFTTITLGLDFHYRVSLEIFQLVRSSMRIMDMTPLLGINCLHVLQ